MKKGFFGFLLHIFISLSAEEPAEEIIGYRFERTTPSGVVLALEQDLRGNVTKKVALDGSYLCTYIWDEHNHLVQMNNIIDDIGIHRTYDDKGRLLQEVYPNDIIINMEYTDDNYLSSITLPDKSKIEYSYVNGFMQFVTRKSPTNKRLYTHDHFHYMAIDSLKRQVTENSIFNNNFQHIAYLNKSKYIIKNHFLEENYKYNDKNQLIEKKYIQRHVLLKDRYTTCYSYDDQGQLKEPFHLFDKDQNLVNSVCEGNRMLSWKDAFFNYDDNGNMIERKDHRGHFYFCYNANNELIEVIHDDDCVQYMYDPLGRRVQKNFFKNDILVDQEYTIYRDNQELARFDKNGNIKVLYVPGAPQANTIRKPVAIELNGQPFEPTVDGLGNLRALANIKSKAINQYSYTPFGKKIIQVEGMKNPYQYQCKPYDSETGLLYYGKRYYDPEIARWISPDPFGTVQKEHLYQYCNNNPFSYHDPLGEFLIIAIPIYAAGSWITFETLALALGCGVAASLTVNLAQEFMKEAADNNLVSQNTLNDFTCQFCFPELWSYHLLQSQFVLAQTLDLYEKTPTKPAKKSTTQSSATTPASQENPVDPSELAQKQMFIWSKCQTCIWEGLFLQNALFPDLPGFPSTAPVFNPICGQPITKPLGQNLNQPKTPYTPTTLSQPTTPPQFNKPTFETVNPRYYVLDSQTKILYSNTCSFTKTATKEDFFLETWYSKKVRDQLKDKDFHSFPESVKLFQDTGTVSVIKGGDGIERKELRIPGCYLGREGVFEFIKEADGEINHRCFVPNELNKE